MMCIALGAAHICISFLIASLLLSPLSIATRYILFDLDSDISSSTTLPPSSSLPETPKLDRFREAPAFRNGKECIISPYAHNHNHDDDDGNEGSDHHHHNSSMIQSQDLCDITSIHIAMTLDVNYLRGSVAAIFSIVKHSACPENLAFHFLSTGSEESLASIITSTFPYLRFRIYRFDEALVKDKISSSIREALEQPLNYARTYIADMLPHCIKRVIYLDSDLIVVDDIVKLWGISLGSHPLGAPEYCQANFTQYFRDAFWANYANEVFNGSDNNPNPSIVVNTMNSDNAGDTKKKKKKNKKEIMMMRMRRRNVMKGKRRPCYFNTGVMVMDLEMWRSHGFSREIERWMKVQQEERIYELGSLPPFLLVFGGNVKEVDHRWNQHGLGGDNIEGRCRPLHPGPVSLLHWSGKGKPWMRLDAQTPCPLDSLWAPYDLLSHHHHHHHHHHLLLLPHHMSSIIAS